VERANPFSRESFNIYVIDSESPTRCRCDEKGTKNTELAVVLM
jgi:hypothetical protein